MTGPSPTSPTAVADRGRTCKVRVADVRTSGRRWWEVTGEDQDGDWVVLRVRDRPQLLEGQVCTVRRTPSNPQAPDVIVATSAAPMALRVDGDRLHLCRAHRRQVMQADVDWYVLPSPHWAVPCDHCVAGVASTGVGQQEQVDRHGNPICGRSFMAGTICTLWPDHDGAHEPTCQECGGDWYVQRCICP